MCFGDDAFSCHDGSRGGNGVRVKKKRLLLGGLTPLFPTLESSTLPCGMYETKPSP